MRPGEKLATPPARITQTQDPQHLALVLDVSQPPGQRINFYSSHSVWCFVISSRLALTDGAEEIVEFREESLKIGKKHKACIQMLALNLIMLQSKSESKPLLHPSGILQFLKVTPAEMCRAAWSPHKPLGCREGRFTCTRRGYRKPPA